MPDHVPLTVEDLLSDSSFREWVHAGCQIDNGSYWSDWLNGNPQRIHLARQAIDILRAAYLDETVGDNEIDDVVAGTWKLIERRESRMTYGSNKFWRRTAAVAASITVFLLGWLALEGNLRFFGRQIAFASRTIPSSWIRKANEGTNSQLVILPDSSSVLLLPGSTLSYPVGFAADVREVNLEGAAFFEIAKRRQQPFLVSANGLLTKVTGTSFSVRAFKREKNVEVVVKTGRVLIYSDHADYKKPNSDATSLLPEQLGIFDKNQARITTGNADPTKDMLTMQHASFEFTDEPVSRLLDYIADTYGLDIKYDASKLRNCVLTTSLNDIPLQGKLNIICHGLGEGVTYEMRDKTIVIKGLTSCD